MNNELHFSSESNEWSTPQDFYNILNLYFNFTLDPCSDGKNNKCKKFYTVNENGLIQDWINEIVFCNPPYGRELNKWVEKCYNEAKKGVKIVLLIPARTDTKYQHQYCFNADYIWFIKGRLKFGNSKNAAPFPSQLVLFNLELTKECVNFMNNGGKLIKL